MQPITGMFPMIQLFLTTSCVHEKCVSLGHARGKPFHQTEQYLSASVHVNLSLLKFLEHGHPASYLLCKMTAAQGKTFA